MTFEAKPIVSMNREYDPVKGRTKPEVEQLASFRRLDAQVGEDRCFYFALL
jgi:hypothetical protein